jgi:sugar/nucleoside kinase (ribokinase family)
MPILKSMDSRAVRGRLRKPILSKAAAPPRSGEAILTLVGVTYRDLDASLDAVEDGKRSGDVGVEFGGFAMNAARAAVRCLPAGAVHLVTLVPWAEYPAVSRSMPEGAIFDPILLDDAPSGRLPDSLVLSDPSRDLRAILKGRHDLHSLLSLERITEGALGASIIAVGRVPAEFARKLLDQCQRRESLFAWCGGSALPVELEAECPILLVDRDEAVEMLEWPDSGAGTGELALALARRARVSGAIRVVTGGGTRPTAAACDAGGSWECLEADPVTIADPKHPKGAGDGFAARFLATAFADRTGVARRKPALPEALQHARFAAAEFVASGHHLAAEEIEAAIAGRSEYGEKGGHALRRRLVPKTPSRIPSLISRHWPPVP